MSADPYEAAWTRGTPSSLVLAFLGVAGAIWLLALVLWEIGRPDLAVVATGLGAAVPVILLFGGFDARSQLWVLRVPPDAAVGPALQDALASTRAADVDAGSLPRGNPLRRCAGVLRLADPVCLVGWAGPERRVHPATPPRDGIVYVLAPPGSGDELALLRGAIARSMRSLPSSA